MLPTTLEHKSQPSIHGPPTVAVSTLSTSCHTSQHPDSFPLSSTKQCEPHPSSSSWISSQASSRLTQGHPLSRADSSSHCLPRTVIVTTPPVRALHFGHPYPGHRQLLRRFLMPRLITQHGNASTLISVITGRFCVLPAPFRCRGVRGAQLCLPYLIKATHSSSNLITPTSPETSPQPQHPKPFGEHEQA